MSETDLRRSQEPKNPVYLSIFHSAVCSVYKLVSTGKVINSKVTVLNKVVHMKSFRKNLNPWFNNSLHVYDVA